MFVSFSISTEILCQMKIILHLNTPVVWIILLDPVFEKAHV